MASPYCLLHADGKAVVAFPEKTADFTLASAREYRYCESGWFGKGAEHLHLLFKRVCMGLTAGTSRARIQQIFSGKGSHCRIRRGDVALADVGGHQDTFRCRRQLIYADNELGIVILPYDRRPGHRAEWCVSRNRPSAAERVCART